MIWINYWNFSVLDGGKGSFKNKSGKQFFLNCFEVKLVIFFFMVKKVIPQLIIYDLTLVTCSMDDFLTQSWKKL